MRNITIGEDELLISFDVSSPFTNVPTIVCMAERTPLSPDRVAELLDMCLRSTYFSYGGEFYEQREGAAMGSPVSSVVANL